MKDICKECKEFWTRTYLDKEGTEKVELGCDRAYYIKEGETTIECDGFGREGKKKPRIVDKEAKK